jgi:colicin import membrane protein
MQIQPHYSPPISPYVATLKCRDSALSIIALVVVLVHFVAIGLSMLTDAAPEKKIARKQVIVKTVQLNQKFEPLVAQAEQTTSQRALVSNPTPAAVLPTPAPPPPVIEKTPVIESPPVIQTPKPVEKTPPKAAPKIEPKKVEVQPSPPKTVKAEPPKTAPPAKKPAAPAAPVKKAEVVAPKPKPKALEVDKKALEAERIKQQQAEKARQEQIAATEAIAQQKKQQLLSQAKESLAKMGEIRDKMSQASSVNISGASIPQRIQQLQIDALPAMGGVAMGSQEIKYQDSLGARLKKDLILPDYGTVKVKLTIAKTGKISKIEVTSPSEKNKKYIEKTLPTLIFPPFGTQFEGAENYTFLLTLHNDE